MNLEPYYGQLIKVYVSEEEWFIGEPIRPTSSEEEEGKAFVVQVAMTHWPNTRKEQLPR